MENIPFRWFSTYLFVTIIAVLGIYIALMGYKYESIGKVHLLHMINQKIEGASKEYLFIGYCEENSLLLGIYYNLIYGKPFYIINYPMINHVAVVLNNTLYTTAKLDHPFKIVYRCEIDESFRKEILTTDNRTLFSILINRLSTTRPIIECKFTPFVYYDKKVLYAGVKVYPWDKIIEWYYSKKKDIIKKVIVAK